MRVELSAGAVCNSYAHACRSISEALPDTERGGGAAEAGRCSATNAHSAATRDGDVSGPVPMGKAEAEAG